MFLGQPFCICIKDENFDLKGSETDVAGIYIIYNNPFLIFQYAKDLLKQLG